MFGSEVLDVAIGLILLFLFVSLICTSIVEMVEAVLKKRAMDLERGIRELLDDRDGTTITRTFFEHPLIYGLYAGNYDPAKLKQTVQIEGLWRWITEKLEGLWQWVTEKLGLGRHDAKTGNAQPTAGEPIPVRMHMGFWSRRSLPSYIPASSFSGAILDIVARGAVGLEGAPSLTPPTVESLRVGALALPNMRLQRAILAALDTSRGDLAQARSSLETWYDATMDRVSGWYKRRTQGVLFLIGLVLAVALNIDAITVARRLNEDPALRKAALAQAEQITRPNGVTGDRLAQLQNETFETHSKHIQEIGYPVGWDPKPQCLTGKRGQDCSLGGRAIAVMMSGWLITAIAVMLGAPFWFDLLNKFMVIRATVKPREKSPEEGSEDRQNSASRPPGREENTQVVSKDTSTASNDKSKSVPQLIFEPHRWNDGSEEGNL